ncbi:hypothetical protein A2U01_0035589, partial [Trifolium medium]|nr:hypothetical protein [Trifolium medium]
MRDDHAAEVEKLKQEVKTQGELASKMAKERDEAVAVSSDLTKEKALLEETVSGLEVSVGAQYDEGFLFALD